MYYILSLLVSIFSLVMTIVNMYAEEGAESLRLFDDTVTWICIGISTLFIIIGCMTDDRRRYDR